MKQQRIVGVVIMLLSVFIVILALFGSTPEERDITLALFLFPLGVYLIFTKSRCTYAAQEEAAEISLPEP